MKNIKQVTASYANCMHNFVITGLCEGFEING